MARERTSSGRSAVNSLAYVLELIGSMFYVIAAVFVMSAFKGAYPYLPVVMTGSVWYPLLYSAAIVGTVLLFIVSFTNLMKSRSMQAHKYGMLISVVAGFAWIGLTAGAPYLSMLVIFGFVISTIGGAYGMLNFIEPER